MKDYSTFLKLADLYQPIPEAKTVEQLPPGMYSTKWDPQKDQVAFVEMNTTHDELVDLPGTAYEAVMDDLDYFLTQECIDRFNDVKLLHKMNILLYGVPGGGKTCIVNRVAAKIIETGGVVLFNPDPRSLKTLFDVFDKLQPNTRVLVIFEELDTLVQKFSEDNFLHVLDGEVQKHNAMFIATTNYIEKVPKRIRRPGRFPVRLEVGLPSYEAREFYLNLKLKNIEMAQNIAKQTDGFTIDQLKEVVRQTYCMKKPLGPVLEFLRKEFDIMSRQGEPQETDDDDWAECEGDEDVGGVDLG